jgi:TetR/AcrR family transcriptional repressor of nem operon
MSKADDTRALLLQKAFDLTYAHGYQPTSVNDILAHTHVTKGAFFYHFKDKDTMGLAMIKEILYPGMQEALIKPLRSGHDPVSELYDLMKGLLYDPLFNVRYGCPAINLIDEMGSVNKKFNKALQALVEEWHEAIIETVETGKRSGKVNSHVNGKQVAIFITAGYAGIRNMGKLYGESCYATYLKEFKKYLETLR